MHCNDFNGKPLTPVSLEPWLKSLCKKKKKIKHPNWIELLREIIINEVISLFLTVASSESLSVISINYILRKDILIDIFCSAVFLFAKISKQNITFSSWFCCLQLIGVQLGQKAPKAARNMNFFFVFLLSSFRWQYGYWMNSNI